MQEAFGITVAAIYKAHWFFGGSLRVQGNTGFSPAMYHREFTALMWQVTPDSAPYYSVDKFVRVDEASRMFYYSLPRDANNNLLKMS